MPNDIASYESNALTRLLARSASRIKDAPANWILMGFEFETVYCSLHHLHTASCCWFLLHKCPQRTTSNEKGFSFEKVGFQKFPSRPKPTWSGHGYSFPEREVSDSSRSADLEGYIQLAKTHWRMLAAVLTRRDRWRNLHLGRILTDMLCSSQQEYPHGGRGKCRPTVKPMH